MPDTHRALVEATLDERLASLLEQTSRIAANDARDRIRRKAWLIVGLVVTLVLGGLISIQVQLLAGGRHSLQVTRTICEQRNRQSSAILHLLTTSNRDAQTAPGIPDERRALAQQEYDTFMREYGTPSDCAVFR